ncbi:oxygenase MpaB family protein [Patulibacter sp. SYSU D01012]|uniref:oxygenase MpaB family protein n=1 Tax=Patulibacter sp. SYSU D01012 TaxID=2817381 RepID=UPI001B302B02|nr:oxygenase MpaB family protein [Patulibacter sp. SYSU D01012]
MPTTSPPTAPAPPLRAAPDLPAGDRGMHPDEVADLGLPIGPGSLLWRLLGDARNLLLAQRTGTLQVMHPTISRALVDHSTFFADPLGRLWRSGTPILRTVYAPDADAAGRAVRDLHRGIQGRTPTGGGYHALDPEAFFWAHATFVASVVDGQRLFGTPLDPQQLDRLYRESITWYARYGVSLRPVPRDHDAFRRYWDAMLDGVLQATPVACFGIRRLPRQPPPQGAVPAPLWAVARPAVVRAVPWLGRATLPGRARRILGLEDDAADRAALAALAAGVRAAWPALPPAVRRLPVARRADARAAPAAV